MKQTRKRIGSLLIAVCMVLIMMPEYFASSAWADDTVWDGTISEVIPEGDVYSVSNSAELAWIAQQVNGGNNFLDKTIKLTKDIVLNESSENYESWGITPPSNTWEPIGFFVNLGLDDRPFEGIFDGQNHTVSGLYINDEESKYKGLFGYSMGTIQKVGVINSYIKGKQYVAGIVGFNTGTISNCYNIGVISGEAFVGGINGNGSGRILDCYNGGAISGTDSYTGGILGVNHGIISNCYNTAKISGNKYVGGIAGQNYSALNAETDAELTKCFNTGTVSGMGDYTGGIAGQNYKKGGDYKAEILYCYNIGAVSGNNYVGGAVGYRTDSDEYSVIKKCYNAGTVSGTGNYINGGVGGYPYHVGCYYIDPDEEEYFLIKTSDQMKEEKFVDDLNFGGSPFIFDSTNVNNGYPILTGFDYSSAQKPIFTTNLSGDASYTKDTTATALSVSANVSDGGTISYQWYSNTENNTTGGTKIDGATKATYIPLTDAVGTTYYYVVVENTNHLVNGVNEATVTSGIKTVIVKADSSSTYSVIVNSGTASPSMAATGATVTITANTPDNGKRFKEWTVVIGGITFANAQASSTTFTMPANAVKVTAIYEDIPDGVTPVTGITLNKTSLSLYSNTNPKTANLTATVTPADATDKSVTWQSSNPFVATVDASGKLTAVGNGTAVITVTTTDGGYTASCTVTVSTYTSGGGSSSGGGSGGGSSSGGDTTKTTITKGNQPNQPITAVASVTATAGTNGTASASISDKAVTDAIAKAQAELKKQSKTANGIAVGLNVTMPKGATTLTATLRQNGLNSLVSAGVTNLEINGAPIRMTFDKKALTEIQKQSSGNVNIEIAPQAELSKMAKALIGTRPVYNITVGYGDNRTVSNFGGGVATVGIPYTPANGEVIGGLYAVYVDENGNATRVAGSSYDANSGCIIFTTTHFSMYGVGYSAPSAEFADISSHWAKESIDYVVGKGLLSGTSETTFAPNTAMTRGMLVTALGRLEGVDVSSYTKNSFTDVKAGSTFKPYIEWAYEKGIIQGIGNNKFAPDRAITREEIAVIVANFAKATGYTLPVKSEATTYADDSSISSTYKTAVTAMQQAGIMMGGTSNKFNPKSNATRAEVSSMLYRYMKLNME